jgi:hypothetical protein
VTDGDGGWSPSARPSGCSSLSAKFILPEMWGYVEQEEAAAVEAALDEAPRRTA